MIERPRQLVERAAIAAASVNVAIHLLLLATGAAVGAFGWVMLGGSLLCLLCIPDLRARRDSVRPWAALGTMNVLMLGSHLVLGGMGAGHHHIHGAEPPFVGLALVASTALSLVEASASAWVARGIVSERTLRGALEAGDLSHNNMLIFDRACNADHSAAPRPATDGDGPRAVIAGAEPVRPVVSVEAPQEFAPARSPSVTGRSIPPTRRG